MERRAFDGLWWQPTVVACLQQHDLPDHLRVALEELLHREELLRDALDVVHAIDAEQERDALELLA